MRTNRRVGAEHIFWYVWLWSVLVLGAGCDRPTGAGTAASNALARATGGGPAPAGAEMSGHRHAASCAHVDGAAIERPVTNFARALADLAAHQQGPRELWRLTPAQLSNVVTAALKDEAASLSLYTDTLAMQSGADRYGNPVTNRYRPLLEYVLTRLWRESPYPSVKYSAVNTLMLEYINTMATGDSKEKYRLIDGEIALADTMEQDINHGIPLDDILDIEGQRLYAMAVDGNEAGYCQQAERMMTKFKRADARTKVTMLVAMHTALNYRGVPQQLRDKYLPPLLRDITERDVRGTMKDDILWEIIKKDKEKYGIK